MTEDVGSTPQYESDDMVGIDKAALERIGALMPGSAVLASLVQDDGQERLWRAATRLTSMITAANRDAVQAEVDRRTELMGAAAANESVADDVMTGRWPR